MRVANRTGEQTVAAIAALRRLRMTGPEIAEAHDRPLSTVSGIPTSARAIATRCCSPPESSDGR
jgi:hypothetical protein